MIPVLLAAAWASSVEAEILDAGRLQTVEGLVDPTLLIAASNASWMSGARLRLESTDHRFGLEMVGTADKLVLLHPDRHAQRLGGVRAMFGFRGYTPLATTVTMLRAGVATVDVLDLAATAHTPRSLGTAGIEVRRYRKERIDLMEADLWMSPELWGGELRSRAGVRLHPSGVFFLFGFGTNRLGSWTPGAYRQVTWQLDSTVLIRPSGP